MNERTMAMAALGVGVVAIGGLILESRRTANPLAPKVVAQTLLSETGGASPAPRRLQIDIQPSPELRRIGEEGQSWEYRVVDASGRIYRREVNVDQKTLSLSLPIAYGHPPSDPRLEVWTDEGRQASVPLRPLPPPSIRSLEALPSHEIRANHPAPGVSASLVDGDPWGEIRIEPARPIPAGETWTVVVLETPLQARLGLRASCTLTTPRPEPSSSKPFRASPPNTAVGGAVTLPKGYGQTYSTIPVLYAEDVTAIRVRVTRTASRWDSAGIVVAGLRIGNEGGQSVLRWNDPKVPNPLGLDLRLVEPKVPYSQYGKGDNRAPRIELKATALPNALKPSETFDGAKLEFDVADVKRLNLRSLTVGDWSSPYTAQANGALPKAPFAMRARLTRRCTEELGSFEATIPVELAS